MHRAPYISQVHTSAILVPLPFYLHNGKIQYEKEDRMSHSSDILPVNHETIVVLIILLSQCLLTN